MKEIIFTVFTPTYNRAHTLERLFLSLANQNYKNFEWLIIDDGSLDNTEELINCFKDKKLIDIQYFRKENGGKPRAINYGVEKARGKYFLMVDSDDYLLPNALRLFDRWVKEIDNDDAFIGVGAARGISDNEYIKESPPIVNESGFIDCTNLERRMYNLDADMVEAYKLDIFKKFPMVSWPGETFAPEQIALNEIALNGYRIRWHKEIVYICEYLDGGLTKDSFNLLKKNPMGYAMMYNHMLKYKITGREKLNAAIQMVALAIVGNHLEYLLETNSWTYTILGLPLGLILAIRRKYQFKEYK